MYWFINVAMPRRAPIYPDFPTLYINRYICAIFAINAFVVFTASVFGGRDQAALRQRILAEKGEMATIRPTVRRGRRLLRLATLAFAQIVAALCIVEVLGQAYFHNPYDYPDRRFLFTSPDSFRNVGRFWTYQPNRQIKEIAIYQRAAGEFEKEYECDYRIDRFGFVDNDDSDRRDYDFLLLGDSFTQGQGGCPWAHTLRQYIRHASIYNAGLQGTGPGTWAPISQYLLEQGLRFRTAVVIFISDDFRRHLSGYNQDLLDCVHDITRCHGQFFYPIVPGVELIASAAERAQGGLSLPQRAVDFWQRHLWVSFFLASDMKHLVSPPLLPPPISEDASRGLDSLTSSFPRLLFIRVRTKDELALRSDDAATMAVGRYLRDRKIAWAECDIGYDGFLPREGHPNRDGYVRLAKCVARIIAGSPMPVSVGTISSTNQKSVSFNQLFDNHIQ